MPQDRLPSEKDFLDKKKKNNGKNKKRRLSKIREKESYRDMLTDETVDEED